MVRIIQVVLAVGLGAAIVAVYRAHLWWVADFAATHLLFPVLVAVVFGIVYGLIGADYGLPSLFWHDRLLTRIGAATAVTLLSERLKLGVDREGEAPSEPGFLRLG